MERVYNARHRASDVNEIPESDPGFGRRIFVRVGLIVIVISGILGFIIGGDGASVKPTIQVYGGITIPTTGPMVALYAVVLSALIVGVLLGAIELASRAENR